ncbi:MAG: hypothetical protein HY921_00550 [Elusimicrobia bacterium]|nr:hypothetical protein [Elusimicrobiota bacterium]
MKSKLLTVAALAAMLAGHAALRWHGLALPMTCDEGEYAYEARLMMQGGLAYRDAYNQKPPAVFFIYRLAYGFSLWPNAPRVAALISSWATMAFLFWTTPASWSPWARLAAPAFFAVLSPAPIGDMGFTANTEVFLCLAMAICAWGVKKSWAARAPWPCLGLAGLAAGGALMTKPTCAWSVLGFLALTCWGKALRWKAKAAVLYLAATAVAPATLAAYFWLRGGLGDFLEQAFWRNLDYVRVMANGPALALQGRWLIGTLLPQFLRGLWPIYLSALVGLYAAGPRRPEERLAAVWLGTSLLGIGAGFYFFPHYFLQAAPAMALAAAGGLQEAGASKNSLLQRTAPLLLAAALLYPVWDRRDIYFQASPQVAARRLLYPNPLYESYPIAAYIRKHSRPTDSIYVFGSEPQIYIHSQRRAATRHITSYPLTLFPRGERDYLQEMRDLERARPKFIVYSGQPSSNLIFSPWGEMFQQAMREFLSREYRLAGEVEVSPEPSAFTTLRLLSGRPDWSRENTLYLFQLRG